MPRLTSLKKRRKSRAKKEWKTPPKKALKEKRDRLM